MKKLTKLFFTGLMALSVTPAVVSALVSMHGISYKQASAAEWNNTNEAAANGHEGVFELQLVQNKSLSDNFEIVGDVTLDLNGYELKFLSDYKITVRENGKLTIKDSTSSKKGKVTSGEERIILESGSSFVLNGGHVQRIDAKFWNGDIPDLKFQLGEIDEFAFEHFIPADNDRYKLMGSLTIVEDPLAIGPNKSSLQSCKKYQAQTYWYQDLEAAFTVTKIKSYNWFDTANTSVTYEGLDYDNRVNIQFGADYVSEGRTFSNEDSNSAMDAATASPVTIGDIVVGDHRETSYDGKRRFWNYNFNTYRQNLKEIQFVGQAPYDGSIIAMLGTEHGSIEDYNGHGWKTSAFFNLMSMECRLLNVKVYKPSNIPTNFLDITIDKEPTESQDGAVIINNPFHDEAYANAFYGTLKNVKWYRSVDGGGYYQCSISSGYPVSGFTQLIDPSIKLGSHKYKYYCEYTVENGLYSAVYESAKYVVASNPYKPSAVNLALNGKLEQQYAHLEFKKGETIKLSAAVTEDNRNQNNTSTGNLYKWQKKSDWSGTPNEHWEDIAGATNATYYVPNDSVNSGAGYRVLVATKGLNNLVSEYAEPVQSYYRIDIVAKDQPVLAYGEGTDQINKEVVNYAKELSVNVSNIAYYDKVNYQWYRYRDQDTTDPYWIKVSDGEHNNYGYAGNPTFTITGSNTNTLSIKCDATETIKLKLEVTGIKDHGKLYSSLEMTMSFVALSKPSITLQPLSVMGKWNGTSTESKIMTVEAVSPKGEVSYQWQRETAPDTWEDIEGKTANTLSFPLDTVVYEFYRCKVSNSAGSVYSNKVYARILDDTNLTAEVTQGLQAATLVDYEASVSIDNDHQILTCHLGDVVALDFEATSDDEGMFNTIETKKISSSYRDVTGLMDAGYPLTGKLVDTSMIGTFEYYGYFKADYDSGAQVIEFDGENTPSLKYTVIVLPGDEPIIDPQTVTNGDDLEIILPDMSFLQNGATISAGGFNPGATWNDNSMVDLINYNFVYGAQLFVEQLSVEQSEEKNYFPVDSVGSPYEMFAPGASLHFDTSDDALCPDEFEGELDAYIVIYYNRIISETKDNLETTTNHYTLKHFKIYVEKACTHANVVFTHTHDVDGEGNITIYWQEKCEACGAVVDTGFKRVYEEGASGLPVMSTPATCTHDGLSDHKECPYCEKMYVLNDLNKWVELDDISNITIFSAHSFTHVDAQEADCTNDGCIEHYHCDNDGCGHDFIKVNDEYVEIETAVIKGGHKLHETAEIEATCHEDGCKRYFTCSECNKVFSDETCEHEIADLAAWKVGEGKIKALGHKLDVTESFCENCHKYVIKIDQTSQSQKVGQVTGFDTKVELPEGVVGIKVEYFVNNAWTETVPTEIGSYKVRLTRAEDEYYLSLNLEINNGLVISEDGTVPVNPDEPDNPPVNPDEPDNPPVNPDTPINPDNPVEPKGNGGLPVGAIVGIAVGGTLVLAVGGFSIFWFVVKKKTFADLIAVFKKK